MESSNLNVSSTSSNFTFHFTWSRVNATDVRKLPGIV